ncbi:hypothetical protein [Streptomyces sp. NPDC003697]
MTTDEPSVNISNVSHSSLAIGKGARSENRYAAPRDESAEALLRAVRELRADLARLNASDETRALDEALADTEGEITRTGTAGDTRRQRLREVLTDAQSVLNLFASAGAVAGLLGL